MSNIKIVATNKKAYHDYFIEDCIEAGIVLVGSEVKSIRLGQVNMKDTYCLIRGDEIELINLHISPYEKGNIFNKDPLRPKKLLMHKKEILKLQQKIAEQGYTLVPSEVYLKGNLVKVKIALAKGKKLYDKRQNIAKKDARREAERDLKVKNLY